MGAFTGRVHGSTIDLDAIPNAPFEGQRIATLPEARWPEIRAALLDVLGFEP